MKGKILISSPSLLTDMIFYKSIILIVDQTDEGITGFILNRRSDLLITREVESSEKIKIDLYYGGPVSSEHFYLLRSEKNYTEIINVYDNLFWGNNLDFLINQVEKGIIKMDDFTLFQGYSGWDMRQLDDEIAKNNWIIYDKKVEEIFSYKEKNSWNNLIKEFGNKYKLWSNSPDDITLN